MSGLVQHSPVAQRPRLHHAQRVRGDLLRSTIDPPAGDVASIGAARIPARFTQQSQREQTEQRKQGRKDQRQARRQDDRGGFAGAHSKHREDVPGLMPVNTTSTNFTCTSKNRRPPRTEFKSGRIATLFTRLSRRLPWFTSFACFSVHVGRAQYDRTVRSAGKPP